MLKFKRVEEIIRIRIELQLTSTSVLRYRLQIPPLRTKILGQQSFYPIFDRIKIHIFLSSRSAAVSSYRLKLQHHDLSCLQPSAINQHLWNTRVNSIYPQGLLDFQAARYAQAFPTFRLQGV